MTPPYQHASLRVHGARLPINGNRQWVWVLRETRPPATSAHSAAGVPPRPASQVGERPARLSKPHCVPKACFRKAPSLGISRLQLSLTNLYIMFPPRLFTGWNLVLLTQDMFNVCRGVSSAFLELFHRSVSNGIAWVIKWQAAAGRGGDAWEHSLMGPEGSVRGSGGSHQAPPRAVSAPSAPGPEGRLRWRVGWREAGPWPGCMWVEWSAECDTWAVKGLLMLKKTNQCR